RALDHVRQALDVAVGMKWPDGAGNEPVVVEDAHRAEAVVLGIAVGVEREMPPSPEPVALDVVDFAVTPDPDHWSSPATSVTLARRVSAVGAKRRRPCVRRTQATRVSTGRY